MLWYEFFFKYGCIDVMGKNVFKLIVWSKNIIRNLGDGLIIYFKVSISFNLLERFSKKWILIMLIFLFFNKRKYVLRIINC